MDARVKRYKPWLILSTAIAFSSLMLCMNPTAYSWHRSYYGGHHYYHHGHAGIRHGHYLPGGYFHKPHRWDWHGDKSGYYHVGRCTWIPPHYNRWGNYIPGHRTC